MAQHYYEHNARQAQAQVAHSDERRHFGLIVTGGALVALAAIAWIATRQPAVDSPLPQPAPEAGTAPAAMPPAAASETFKVPAQIRTAAAQPAPVAAASVTQPVTAPTVAKAADPEGAPSMPSSEDVAATGDTRTVQP